MINYTIYCYSIYITCSYKIGINKIKSEPKFRKSKYQSCKRKFLNTLISYSNTWIQWIYKEIRKNITEPHNFLKIKLSSFKTKIVHNLSTKYVPKFRLTLFLGILNESGEKRIRVHNATILVLSHALYFSYGLGLVPAWLKL